MTSLKCSRRVVRILLLLSLLAIGAGVGFGFARMMYARRGMPDLAKAFQIAEDAIDRRYGKGVFVRGFRRVLQDGDKDYYAFQVKAETESVRTNILVNVDMTKSPSRVELDYAAGYSFKGEFAF